MTQINRRALLGSTAAVIGTALAPRVTYAAAAPPVARVTPFSETIFGTKIIDRYRWMEAKDAEWKSYALGQAAYAAKILAAIPGRDALVDQVAHYTSAITALTAVQAGGPYIFTQVRPKGSNLAKLYVREGVTGADRLLIDPDHYATKGAHAALDWWAASPDGSHVVFGTSPGGSEQSTLRVLVTATGALLPEVMDRTPDASPGWLPDSSGFFYNRLRPGVSPESEEYEEKSVCWFHKLSTAPAGDLKVLGQNLSLAASLSDIDMPFIVTAPGSDVALGTVAAGVQIELTLYAASISDAAAGKPAWQKICGPEAKVTNAAVLGETIYLMTHQNAPRYRIVKTSAQNPAFAHATEAVPQTSAVIRNLAAARDGIYLQDLDAGIGGLRKLAPDGGISQIKLPFQGSIDALYADTLHDGAWFLLEGWVKPAVLCYVDAGGTVSQTSIAPQPPLDVAPYTAEETTVTARDGARVPLSIVYRKDLKRDGTAPLLLWAYGAYGITEDPSFIARWLPLLDAGGIFALAHVRGGGELGEDWHLAGKKHTKPNTWRDMIDCAEALIARHYTSRQKLAIIGGSAGGITVGRFLTERPDLAAVVISAVGVSNALRSEFSPNGPPNIPEFGTVKNPDDFKALYAMDAYQHVRDGTRYPAVLLTTGLNDPRVEPWELTKMTARLQAATSSHNPILLRIDTDAGHGFGSTRSQRDRETADIIAFLLWRTGDARYQPQ